MNPCIEWTKSRNRQGYGRTWSGLAHREAYAQARGAIPDGMTIDHLCFNPGCVNVDHMRLLTRAQNAANNKASMKTACVNGHAYDAENTYVRPSGQRDCRACIRDRSRRYQARKRAGRMIGSADFEEPA